MDYQQLVRSFYETVNSRDTDKLLSFFSDDGQFKNVSTDETFRGKNEIRRMHQDWIKAFPDGKIEVQKVFGSGDDWSAEINFIGTHQGPLSLPSGDIPATGKKVKVPASDILTFKNGKIQSFNCYLAATQMLNQIGAIQAKKAA